MRVVIINEEGKVTKSTEVKGSAYVIMKRMAEFLNKDYHGNEIALVGDDDRELVRLVHEGVSVEARLPVSNLLSILKRAGKARHFEDLFKRAMESREGQE